MKDIVYWLKQIFDRLANVTSELANISSATSTSNQSDWTENDATKASYIRNKPAPAELPALIVEGALDTSGQNPVFEAAEDAPSYAEAKAFITEGKGVVFLTYSGVYEMITLVGADALSGSESSWLEPSSQEEAGA